MLSSVRVKCFLFCFLLAPMVFVSCKEEVRPLTTEQVKDFARKLETSVSKREAGFMDGAIDRKALIRKAKIPSEKNSDAFKRGLNKGMNIGTSLVQALSDKATYTLVKQYQEDNVFHLLFRLYDKGSLNYHDLELTSRNGEPKIADMFIYTSGEKLSESLHNIFLQFADMITESSTITENDEWLRKMPEIRKLMAKGKYRDAVEIYNKIPEKIRLGRAFQILHVEVSSGLTSTEYSEALEEYQRLFPNEPNMHLLLLDGFIIHHEYDKALNAVNEIDKMINKDPLLDYYRYLCYKLMQDDQKGKECLLRLVKNMPDFEDGILALISIQLADKNYEAARPLVEKFRNKSSYDQSSLDLVLIDYPDFTK